MAKSAKIMESRKGGICMKCLGPIEVGELIAYQRNFGAAHVVCPEAVVVEEHYEFVVLSDPDEDPPEFGVRVIRPDGALGLEGEEVTFTTSKGKEVTVELGPIVQGFEQRHAIYAKAEDANGGGNGNGGGVTEIGVYETPDGVIYRVKRTKDGERLYAEKLVEIDAQRALEFGGRVQIEFEYERGAISRLHPEDRMSYERAKELTIRYGRCIVCGRRLKAAQSVEDGIGPVCKKSFSGYFGSPESTEPEEGGDIVMPSSLPATVAEQLEGKTPAEQLEEVQRMLAELRGES